MHVILSIGQRPDHFKQFPMQAEFEGRNILRLVGEGHFYALSQLHGEIVPYLIQWLEKMIPSTRDTFEERTFAAHLVRTTFEDFCLQLPRFKCKKDLWLFFLVRLASIAFTRHQVLYARLPMDSNISSLQWSSRLPGCLLIGYPYANEIIQELKTQQYEARMDV